MVAPVIKPGDRSRNIYLPKIPNTSEASIQWKGYDGRLYKGEYIYTLKHANPDSTKNVLLLKNPQFLPNHNETL